MTMASRNRVAFGCLCGTDGHAHVAADGRPVYAECQACGFVWRITRTFTSRGIALAVRPSKCGRKAIEFTDDAGKTMRVEPGTLFPEA